VTDAAGGGLEHGAGGRPAGGPAGPADGRIDVVATTISGSIQDWKKVERIVPLFASHGVHDVSLHAVDSHRDARTATAGLIREGARAVISAGGSGTFNAVLEGCCDSGVPLGEIRLGFLRKGSADLIGKVLGMPDEIESAIRVFVESIRGDRTVPCDVILARTPREDVPDRHFVGYGGAEIFGRIPHYTENRCMKYYKGVLSQFFGDLGPFTTGMSLAMLEKMLRRPWTRPRRWTIRVDGETTGEGGYQSLVVVNGYLGPNLPWSSDPLGSGRIHLFALRDLGLARLIGQAKRARSADILRDPERWGMEAYAGRRLELAPRPGDAFPVNVDGATMLCSDSVTFEIVDAIRLISSQ
jgi:diacylglycerol kinase family enzyme